MNRVIDDEAFRSAARINGPAHAAGHFTWDHSIDRVVPLLSR